MDTPEKLAERPGGDALREVFAMRLAIRWGDLDVQGHVNNTVYFRYMEELRVTWFRSLEAMSGGHAGCVPVVVNARMDFLKELQHPGELDCRMLAGKLGRSSFETGFELRRVDDPGILYATGGAKCVWVDRTLGKSVPLPAVLRSFLQGDPAPAGA
jgi:acyl-CoA thioester hydrolase